MPLNAVTSHTISIQDHRIYYLERKGQTSNSPLLILFHGFPENAHTWEALIDALPANYHVTVSYTHLTLPTICSV